jgi:hypothetical protein
MIKRNNHNRARSQLGFSEARVAVCIASLIVLIGGVWYSYATDDATNPTPQGPIDSPPSSQPQIGKFCIYAVDGSTLRLEVSKVELDGMEAIPATTAFPPKLDDRRTDEALEVPTTLAPPATTTAPPTAEEMMENRLGAAPC